MDRVIFLYAFILGIHLIHVNPNSTSGSSTIVTNTTVSNTTELININQTSSTPNFTTSTVANLSTSAITTAELMNRIRGSGNYSFYPVSTASINNITANARGFIPPTNSACNTTTHIGFANKTCLPKINIQINTVSLLRNTNCDDMTVINALSLYITATTYSNLCWNTVYMLTASEIEGFFTSIRNVTFILNSNTSFIMTQQLYQTGNIPASLGAYYTHDVGGGFVNMSNEYDIINNRLTAAAIFRNQSLINVTYVRIFIIDIPTTYQIMNISSRATLASSVIVASVERTTSQSTPMNISLYFQPLDGRELEFDVKYSCVFYDLNSARWNESGCTKPLYNVFFNRYECSCNHLSTFALISFSVSIPCLNEDEIQWINGTCLSKLDAQKLAFQTLLNTTNEFLIGDLLSIYISAITNASSTTDSNYILSIGDIDRYVSDLVDTTYTISNSDLFLMTEILDQSTSEIALGAAYIRGIGGELVTNDNKAIIQSLHFSAAAIIASESLNDIQSLSILIIGKPSPYRSIDIKTHKTVASSIIVVSASRNTISSVPMNISLYFQVINEWKPNTTDVRYLCSYYDTNTSQWSESGCTLPLFNAPLNRYECNCSHLTSFALIWLPNVPLTSNLSAQDIASLVFECLSIVCFLCIIAHAVIIRLRNPLVGLQTLDLLPLISTAFTTILFIFHIALALTVYTNTTSLQQTQCFRSASVLMFFVYFFLILMFCGKTSVGYFNYLRFVCLFPQPSRRKLFIMLLISFLVSISCVALAIGFNSNSSFAITQLYPYKLCWFSRHVLHYFLTIPVCLFLLINIFLFVTVAVHIISHVRRATSPHQSYERMKRCVIVLLSSCLSEGIGWLFGPILTFVNPKAGEVLGWFFVVFNGLEGFFSIVLYILIRFERVDEQKRVIAARRLKKTTYRNTKESSADIVYSKSVTSNSDDQTESTEVFKDSIELKK